MVQFRSETMRHGTVVLPAERARAFIDVLGRRANVQIVDMNSHTMHRQYKKYIQRIDEMERILRFLFEEICKLPGANIEKGKIENFLDRDDIYELDAVEDSLKKLYSQFVNFRDNNADLLRQKNAAIEEKAVATAALRSLAPELARGMSSTSEELSSYRENIGLMDAESGGMVGATEVMGFSNLAGVIKAEDQEKFARTVFRATRGNAFTLFDSVTEDVIDTQTLKPLPVTKNVFVIYYQGTSESAVHERIVRICQAFGVSSYAWPRSHQEARRKMEGLGEVIGDKIRALEAYEEYFMGEIGVLLETARPGGNSLIEEWRLFCVKEKSIYATLNLFEGSDVTLRAECWFAAPDEDKIRQLLLTQSNAQQVSAFLLSDQRPLSTTKIPPTYFRCTEFSLGFQEFVNTYGVPRYKEANPALITIITLPFLFGVMYGDMGHGMFILLSGLYMVIMWHRQLKYSDNEVLQMIGGGRHMVLLMGLFAVYAGALYNDFFALGLDFFGTRYISDPNKPPRNGEQHMIRDPNRSIYPFGFDPAWKGATNEIDFFNSFKMKFSVIVAFFQMGAGILHKALNAAYFKDHLTFWFEFVPQIIFFCCLVGYMDLMIIYKWVTPLSQPKPNIITNIINMFFFKVEDPFWSFQKPLQVFLVLVMLICIPWMLFCKPLIRRAQHEKLISRRASLEMGENAEDRLNALKDGHRRRGQYEEVPTSHTAAITISETGEGEHEDFNFSEEFIHQVIETIEFVLGVISNTASYLRLWALSLAHQQLALVFFENIILNVLRADMNVVAKSVSVYCAFAFFAYITFGVMLCMDSLECFLHALRLQWVEFQNKFFKADGIRFIPFKFISVLTDQE